MTGFFRTMVIGLAAIGVVLLVAAVTFLAQARGKGWSNERIRDLVLRPDERAWLARQHEPPRDPSPFQGPPLSVDEALAKLAESANAQRANDLVRDLRARAASLGEREAEVARREAEIQIARADLARTQRLIETQQQQVAEREAALARSQADWAQRQLADTARLTALSAAERTRYQEQARLFEQMKDNAWQSLRRFPPKEIARYLAFMEPKKAARMLVLAQQDESGPGLVTQIHREQMALDLTGATETQIDRLAGLYALMPAAQVLPFLADASEGDVADIFLAMAKGGNLKQRAALLEALQRADPRRAMAIQRQIESRTPPASGG